MEQDSQPPWQKPGWKEETKQWIQAELTRQGLRINGPITEVKYRPWSAVLQIPTTGGNVSFKASLPIVKHEVAVTIALSQWRPDCLLPVLAANPERGWLLLPDGGTTLRDVIRENGDHSYWEQVLPHYAEFQIEMAGRVPELLALGEPDERLSALPGQFERLLEDKRMLRLNQEKGLKDEEYGRLQALVPEFGRLCQELASYHVAESLNHGDFHDGNIFYQDGRFLIFDWGDSTISHPFYSLRTTFVSLYWSLDIDEGSPELDRLRDIYLEAWTGYEPAERLREAFKLSQRLAAVNGALVWHRILSKLEGAAREEYAVPVPALLQEFLELGDG